MAKLFLLIGSILAGLSVAIGAFGAHGLRTLLEQSNRTETFETAVKYQFYHALALMIVGIVIHHKHVSIFINSGWCMTFGTVIFSGSLYVLCLTGRTWLGAVTPIGGVVMIAGWILLAWGISQQF